MTSITTDSVMIFFHMLLPHLHLAQMTPIFRGKSSNEVKKPLNTTTPWTIKLMAKSDQPPTAHSQG